MTLNRKTLAAVLTGLALTTAAGAQFGGGPTVMPGTATTGAPGAIFNRGQMPFAAGTVSAVNASAGTITLAPMFGTGEGQTVKVMETTQITALMEVTVGDLKVGDTVQVRGVPTGIVASQITAARADSPQGGMGGPFISPRAGGPADGGRIGIRGPQAAYAQATGEITSLSPLTISLSDSVQVTLKVVPATKISKNASVKIGDLKPGDRIMASGQTDGSGVFTASRISVNADYGMGMR